MLALPIVDNELTLKIEQLNGNGCDLWSSPYYDKRDNVHAFFQYPAMMVPTVQKHIVDAIRSVQPEIRTIFDPFVGAGTTLTASMHAGLDCFGQDINPLAILISRAKAGPFFCTALMSIVEHVVAIAEADESEHIDVDFPNLHKWFREDVAKDLSRLRRAIREQKSIWARRFLWVALAETVRLISNDRTSTYKLHARTSKEIQARNIDAIQQFSSIAFRNLADMRSFRDMLEKSGQIEKGRFVNRVQVTLADSTNPIMGPDNTLSSRYDLVITSPPYGDNTSTIPYGQHSYLPLQWIDLGDIDNHVDRSYLRTTMEIDRRSLGGPRSRDWESSIESLRGKSSALSGTFDQLKDKPRDRTMRITRFYRDFEIALAQIVKVVSLNGYMVWIVGNRRVGGTEIPNDQILTELLKRRNVELVIQVNRRIHQKRMPHRNPIAGMMDKERILIFRKTRDLEECGE